jgi:hypothetical protein
MEQPFALSHRALESFVEDLITSASEGYLDAIGILKPRNVAIRERGTRGFDPGRLGFQRKRYIARDEWCTTNLAGQ